MKTLARLVTTSTLLACMTLPLHSDGPENLDNRLRTIQEKYEIVGLSTAVINANEVAFRSSLGFADIDRQIPVSADTYFRVASISKIAASIALMQQWEQEKFQLDDDISDTLGYRVANPHFPDKPITFRHLLTHTSGLKDGPNYNRFLMATYRAAAEAEEIRQLLHEDGDSYNNGSNFSKHPPGSHYAYSNLNYGIIGTLIEKLSDERFDAYCRRNIFDPLGMSASFDPADLSDIDALSILYRPGDSGWDVQFDEYKGISPEPRIGRSYQPGHNAIVFSPQGGMRARALDLAKLMAAVMDPTSNPSSSILQEETIELMLDEQWANGKSGRDYRGRGLGFHRTHNIAPGELWIGHSGRAYGLLAGMYFHPETHRGIILITNGSKPGRQTREFYEMEHAIYRAAIDFLNTSHPTD